MLPESSNTMKLFGMHPYHDSLHCRFLIIILTATGLGLVPPPRRPGAARRRCRPSLGVPEIGRKAADDRGPNRPRRQKDPTK